MKTIIFLFCAVISVGCSHLPRCGNPEGTKVILSGKDNCQVRIRQVMVGEELKLPEGLKQTAISEFVLSWKETELRDGQIELGHYVLVPVDRKKEGQQ